MSTETLVVYATATPAFYAWDLTVEGYDGVVRVSVLADAEGTVRRYIAEEAGLPPGSISVILAGGPTVDDSVPARVAAREYAALYRLRLEEGR